jgi:toxin HigB-1
MRSLSRGVDAVRRVPGYHDEPLSGKRFGQRSIRLSKSYRAFYEIDGTVASLVRVLEVNKHEY